MIISLLIGVITLIPKLSFHPPDHVVQDAMQQKCSLLCKEMDFHHIFKLYFKFAPNFKNWVRFQTFVLSDRGVVQKQGQDPKGYLEIYPSRWDGDWSNPV